MKAYIDAILSEPEQLGTSFLVVTGSQGIGKSTVTKRLLAGYWEDAWWKRGRWVLPIEADLQADEKLDLSSMLIQALSIQKLPDNYPSTKAGPMGYLCETERETDLDLELEAFEPVAGIIRSTNSTSITLKHWQFALRFWVRARRT